MYYVGLNPQQPNLLPYAAVMPQHPDTAQSGASTTPHPSVLQRAREVVSALVGGTAEAPGLNHAPTGPSHEDILLSILHNTQLSPQEKRDRILALYASPSHGFVIPGQR